MTKQSKPESALVEITGLSHGGEGVGRIDSTAVFVPHAIPGDVGEVEIVHRRKNYFLGRLVNLKQSSPERIDPPCPHAPACGGCQLQHMSYAGQVSWKRLQVEEALRRIGGLEVEVAPVLRMSAPIHYRSRAQLPLGGSPGQVTMGFFRRGTHEIVDMQECMVQHPLMVKLAQAVRRTIADLRLPPYDEVRHRGIFRHAVIKASFSDETLMLVLVTRTESIPLQEEIVERLRREVPELVSIAHNINPTVTNVVYGERTKVIWGETYIYEQIGGMRYAISPRSFFQVNPQQTKALYDEVRRLANLSGGELVLDLYCGTGTIGLYLAKRAGRIVGVETIPDAVSDAKYNAAINRVSSAEFIQGQAEAVVPDLVRRMGEIDVAIVDPPRKGCEEAVLKALAQADVGRIIYVSCNPATLARDLAYLRERGYTPGRVQPVDMFPWTSHVESVVLLSRRS
jgi:23S rRNA (uracil1939-C5)-methyltransferase